ncbi:alpha/beta fold hydrolase [Streptomyces chartreusis]|uniref:alpha/beta fold hydrolase n=1 Tax=Streptomyces chartreusis TaxID=1969 RepID=UPI00362D9337
MSDLVLERAAAEFANATAKPPLLHELGVEGARKLLDDVHSGPMAATQRPAADAALVESASAPAWRDIPSWVLVATEDRNIPAQVQIFMAERTKATVVTVDASHTVAVNRPGDAARLIDEAVRATG